MGDTGISFQIYLKILLAFAVFRHGPNQVYSLINLSAFETGFCYSEVFNELFKGCLVLFCKQ